MKVLIAGSRGINEFNFDGLIPTEADLIISGGARGIDTLAEKYADKNNISKLILRPKYEKYGKSAPLIRNKEMIELADFVLVVWDGSSRGTKYTIDYSKKLGKQIAVVTEENKDIAIAQN